MIEKKWFKNHILISAVLGILSIWLVFFVGHFDSNAIVGWGLELLRTIKAGDFYDYQNNLQSMNLPTNYGIFTNALTAVILLPLFLVELIGAQVTLIVYITWYKCILCVVFVWILKNTASFVSFLGYHSTSCVWLLGLSVISLYYGIAMGQVDLLSVLFLTLALRMWEKQSYYKMALFLSFAFLVKAFPIMAIAPLFIYLFKTQFLNGKKREFTIEAVICVLPLVLERWIETVCIDDYMTYANMVNEINFIPRLKAINIGGVSVYILVTLLTLFIYFIRVMLADHVSKKELLLCIDTLYLWFYLFVEYSPQYLMYGYLFIVITVCVTFNDKRAVLSIAALNAGVLALSISRFNESLLNAMLMSNSLWGERKGYSAKYVSNLFSPKVNTVFFWSGKTIVVLSFVIIMMTCAVSESNRICKKENAGNKMGSVLNIIPVLLYTVLILWTNLFV